MNVNAMERQWVASQQESRQGGRYTKSVTDFYFHHLFQESFDIHPPFKGKATKKSFKLLFLKSDMI